MPEASFPADVARGAPVIPDFATLDEALRRMRAAAVQPPVPAT